MPNTMKTVLKITLAAGLCGLLILICFYYLLPGTTAALLIKTERKAAGLTRRTLSVDGLQYTYLEGGDGPPLILLHGFSADKDNWTRVASFLTPHLRVIAPDLAGFGETQLPVDNDYSIETQVERLRKFAQALNLSTHHLGGSSMGGAIAGAYAVQYTTDILSLVLFAPAGVQSAKASDMFRLLEKAQHHPLIAKNSETYDYLLDFVFYEKPFIPSPIKKTLIKAAVQRRPLYQHIFKQLVDTSTASLEDLLTGLPVPTLIIWGSRDRVLHPSGASILKKRIPQARVEIMDDVGHLPMIEKPKVSARAYLRFMSLE